MARARLGAQVAAESAAAAGARVAGVRVASRPVAVVRAAGVGVGVVAKRISCKLGLNCLSLSLSPSLSLSLSLALFLSLPLSPPYTPEIVHAEPSLHHRHCAC
jgi:hypothetical protein